ncbi:MAG: hypothetical protein ACR2P3_00735, partial [Geminicoccaceae bacterium]
MLSHVAYRGSKIAALRKAKDLIGVVPAKTYQAKRPLRRMLAVALFIVCAAFSILIQVDDRALAEETSAPDVIAVGQPVLGDHIGAASTHFDKNVFVAALERSLRNTRKFKVVPRDQAKLDILEVEQDFALSPDSAGNAAADGVLLAVDLVVIPTVTLFEFGSRHRPVPRLENRFHRSEAGRLEVQVDVIASDTSLIIGSYTLTDSFASKETTVSGKQGTSARRFVAMADSIGRALAENVLRDAFPIKVIQASEDGQRIYLNRGADGGLSLGDTLTLYKAGGELIDPDTGENLGSTEEELGKIKITNIQPKVSIARFLDQKRT